MTGSFALLFYAEKERKKRNNTLSSYQAHAVFELCISLSSYFLFLFFSLRPRVRLRSHLFLHGLWRALLLSVASEGAFVFRPFFFHWNYTVSLNLEVQRLMESDYLSFGILPVLCNVGTDRTTMVAKTCKCELKPGASSDLTRLDRTGYKRQ
jgi:hypothetical protein